VDEQNSRLPGDFLILAVRTQTESIEIVETMPRLHLSEDAVESKALLTRLDDLERFC
jgi:hypothetical protein